MCACEDLLKAFESSLKSDFFSPKSPILGHASATISELPSDIKILWIGRFFKKRIMALVFVSKYLDDFV